MTFYESITVREFRMSRILFTAAGCARCSIAKKFMLENGIACEEHEATGDGKERFGQFYRANRGAIFRGQDGIEFPVLADDAAIHQGVGVIIGYLHAGSRLDGFIGRSDLSKGWVGGLHVSGGDATAADALADVLRFLKQNGLKLQLATDGRNASVLQTLLAQGLGDRVIMDLKGPPVLYRALAGAAMDAGEILRTITLVTRFPEYRFETTVAPVRRQGEDPVAVSYLTPAEIEEAARWLKEVTGSHKLPYFLRAFNPQTCSDDGFKSLERLPANAAFRYRSAARKHQVLTESEKGSW
jgi:pyruvate-formate lyase-activating enzyme